MEFKPVKSLEMLPALHRAWDVLTRDAGRDVKIDEKMLLKLAEMGGGDVRRAIGLLEQLFFCSDDAVTEEDLRTFVPRAPVCLTETGIRIMICSLPFRNLYAVPTRMRPFFILPESSRGEIFYLPAAGCWSLPVRM